MAANSSQSGGRGLPRSLTTDFSSRGLTRTLTQPELIEEAESRNLDFRTRPYPKLPDEHKLTKNHIQTLQREEKEKSERQKQLRAISYGNIRAAKPETEPFHPKLAGNTLAFHDSYQEPPDISSPPVLSASRFPVREDYVTEKINEARAEALNTRGNRDSVVTITYRDEATEAWAHIDRGFRPLNRVGSYRQKKRNNSVESIREAFGSDAVTYPHDPLGGYPAYKSLPESTMAPLENVRRIGSEVGAAVKKHYRRLSGGVGDAVMNQGRRLSGIFIDNDASRVDDACADGWSINDANDNMEVKSSNKKKMTDTTQYHFTVEDDDDEGSSSSQSEATITPGRVQEQRHEEDIYDASPPRNNKPSTTSKVGSASAQVDRPVTPPAGVSRFLCGRPGCTIMHLADGEFEKMSTDQQIAHAKYLMSREIHNETNQRQLPVPRILVTQASMASLPSVSPNDCSPKSINKLAPVSQPKAGKKKSNKTKDYADAFANMDGDGSKLDSKPSLSRVNNKAEASAAAATWCLACGKKTSGMRCSQCPNVYYCSKACQVNNWELHKVVCQSRLRNVEKKCIVCSTPCEGTCPSCLKTYYCSTECQDTDWEKGHYKVCNALALCCVCSHPARGECPTCPGNYYCSEVCQQKDHAQGHWVFCKNRSITIKEAQQIDGANKKISDIIRRDPRYHEMIANRDPSPDESFAGTGERLFATWASFTKRDLAGIMTVEDRPLIDAECKRSTAFVTKGDWKADRKLALKVEKVDPKDAFKGIFNPAELARLCIREEETPEQDPFAPYQYTEADRVVCSACRIVYACPKDILAHFKAGCPAVTSTRRPNGLSLTAAKMRLCSGSKAGCKKYVDCTVNNLRCSKCISPKKDGPVYRGPVYCSKNCKDMDNWYHIQEAHKPADEPRNAREDAMMAKLNFHERMRENPTWRPDPAAAVKVWDDHQARAAINMVKLKKDAEERRQVAVKNEKNLVAEEFAKAEEEAAARKRKYDRKKAAKKAKKASADAEGGSEDNHAKLLAEARAGKKVAVDQHYAESSSAARQGGAARSDGAYYDVDNNLNSPILTGGLF